MDIAITQDRNGQFQIGLNAQGTDLATDDGLTTAVILSLFTDRRAHDDDEIPDGTGDRRGWWADSTMGSRLWLLSRAKELPDTLERAKEYAEEALAWLLDDGVASRIAVTTDWASPGVVGIHARIDRAAGGSYEQMFLHTLRAA